MSKKTQKCEGVAFPYENSAIVSGAFIVAFLLSIDMLADPHSGQIKDQRLAWLVMALLPVLIATVFCVEYRLRNKCAPAPMGRSTKCNSSTKC